MLLFHSLIMSHIRYGITLWHYSHVNLRKKIQACANKFIRLVFFLKPRDSVRQLLKDNDIPSVHQIFNVEIAKMMQRVHIGIAPQSINDIFDRQKRTLNCVTRSSASFFPSSVSTSKASQCLSFIGPKIWNAVPIHIKNVVHELDDKSLFVQDFVPLQRFKINMKRYAVADVDYFK